VFGDAFRIRIAFRNVGHGESSQPLIEQLTIEPRCVDLGIAASNGQREYTLTVRNHSHEAIVIDRIELSCECLTVSPALTTVGPREARNLHVRADLSREPDFRGTLVLVVTVIAVDGRSARSEATLAVQPIVVLEQSESFRSLRR
jgi:hypothetical protein